LSAQAGVVTAKIGAADERELPGVEVAQADARAHVEGGHLIVFGEGVQASAADELVVKAEP